MNQAFQKLIPFLEKKRRLGHLLSLLNYDVETTAPEQAIEAQYDLISFYSAEYASISKDPEYIALVKQAKEEGNLSEEESLLIGDLLERIEYMEKLPIEKYREWDKAISKCTEMWKKAKNASDYSLVEPYFEKLIAIKIEEAELLKRPHHKTRYDAFLSQFEKGQTEADVDAVFEPLKRFLIENLPAVLKKQSKYPAPKILPHNKDEQAHLSTALLEAIGYDLNRGVLRETEHPFSDSVARNDCRVTTHYYEEDWRSSMFSVIHEGGHAIEFQGWSQFQFDHYLEGRASAAICETHSRLFENIIGRNRAFAPVLLKLCREHLGGEFEEMKEGDFYHAINWVEPSFIRTEADEYTYCLHIIIRYELERDLINGKIAVKDIRDAWNQKYHDYLGIEVPSDALGILQDVHWFSGLIGYFPSYALGNLYGAQIWSKLKESLPVEDYLREGKVALIRDELITRDFAFDYLDPKDWIMKVCGESMNPQYFLAYLQEKYLA